MNILVHLDIEKNKLVSLQKNIKRLDKHLANLISSSEKDENLKGKLLE